ncbi:esterase family protein [Gordonia desulfuricans]|uniref:Esterase family protein n=1 Tax=Gordonia desulfuricans TaxID=89051 RepID=A0A7K3LUF3_9ACTN|nr:alpha/beta hydrolase family protein [Gordonia desulfuricans]NDK91809.1 esterase family protein [Gordonia desulfuricans]
MRSPLKRSVHKRVGRRVIAVVIAATALVIVGASGGGPAEAATFNRIKVGGCGMPASPVDIWSRPGNYKTVIALDGLRATSDMSGWRHETRIQRMASSGVNVVEPVGGLGSFYTDWESASPGSKIAYRYRWTCRLDAIVRALDARGLAVGPWHKYAVMGISMGGGAAMIYGAYHRARISHVFSMSGYVNISAPTMREAVRLALLDAGVEGGVGPLSADAMWGPPWAPRWERNDALVQLPRMRGMKIRVASGSATWGPHNTDAVASVKGTPLEVVALAQSRAFEVAAALQGIRISTDFPNVGTHQWDYWEDMVWRAKRAGWFLDR